MNVFDFDRTIYFGDSTLDFYCFCLKRDLKLLVYLPKQILGIILYKSGKIEKTQMKERFFIFLEGIRNIDELVGDFWLIHRTKIEQWYLNIHRDDDLVISASPEFLLEPICKELNIKNLIASKVDQHNGKFYKENCYGEQKVTYFLEKYPDDIIDTFYTDSQSDRPMAKLASHAYLIKKHKMILWKA